MALSEINKLKIVTLLAWPARVIDPDSKVYNSVVNDRLNNLSPAMEGLVIEKLDSIEKTDNRLDKAICKAGVQSVGNVHFNGREFGMLRKERSRLIGEVSDILDISDLRSTGMIKVVV